MRNNELIGELNSGLTYYINKNTTTDGLEILLLNKSGSRNEGANKKGLCHLLEHVCLSYYLFDSQDMFVYNSDIINPKSYVFSGYTDFDKIVLRIHATSENEPLENIYYIVQKIISGDIINKNVLSKVKEEVIYECDYYAKKGLFQNKVLSFLTDNSINDVPRGTSDVIKSITLEDLIQFHKENFILNKLAIIVLGNVDVIDTKNNLIKMLDNNTFSKNFHDKMLNTNFTNTAKVRIHDYLNQYTTVKVFYKLTFRNITIKKRLIKHFFDEMLESYLLQELTLKGLQLIDVRCIDKRNVDFQDYYMIIYKINSCAETYNVYLDIINKLIADKFNINTYKSKLCNLKKTLSKIKETDICISTNSIINEYIQNFFEDQVIFDIKEDYYELINTIENITIDDINALIDPILNNNFKFITQSKEYPE